MLDIANMAEKSGVGFFDLEYATKISYAAIYTIANLALPNHRVDFYHTAAYEEIRAQKPTNYFGIEARKVYLDMNGKQTTHYGANEYSQAASISKTLRNGGAAIPLLDANTLYGNKKKKGILKLADKNSSHKGKASPLHVVALTGLTESGDISVVDPEPGYSNTPILALLDSLNMLRIKSGKLTYDQAQEYAKKYHPYHSVYYSLPTTTIIDALRWCTITINPR